MQNEVKSSGMEEFEKQLEGSSNIVDLDNEIERLDENKLNVIDGRRVLNKNINNSINQPPPNNLIKVQKNVVLAFQSDSTGCGFIRAYTPFSYLNFVFGKDQTLLPIVSSCFIQDQNVLLRTRTIYFQRQMSAEHLEKIKWYKQHQSTYKYRMIHEMDDFLFWEDDARTKNGVPPYNFGAPGITEEVKKSCIEIMNLMDLLIVSTPYLEKYYKKVLGIKVPIKVIPNYAAKFFWKDSGKTKITERIVKPKILYTGSPTHYRNPSPEDPRKMYGDWENPAWREFIIKNVKEDKIKFTCMGGLPWFFEEIKDKIKVIGWVNSYQYHLAVQGEKADFGLMPLVPNRFNYSKSDLKYCEYAASKILSIGTYFPEAEHPGPYNDVPVKLNWNCSLKEIEDTIQLYCDPEKYNKIIDQQYKWLDDEGRWLESPKWVNNFISVL